MSEVERAPAVAGRFYPGSASALARSLSELVPAAVGGGEPVTMAMVPHAGYVYSGKLAGATISRVAVPEHVLVMCPNHTGRGVRRSLWSGGAWRLPTGLVPVDQRLLEVLREHANLSNDEAAHMSEHAIEVQLPLLRARQPSLQVAPLCLGPLRKDECVELGEQLASAVDAFGEPVLIVSSTDMSHYVSAETAHRQDNLALERVLALDPEGLYDTVTRHQISMCGFVPTTVGMVAARALGATRAELVGYTNSGETSGDFEHVVGYAGALLS